MSKVMNAVSITTPEAVATQSVPTRRRLGRIGRTVVFSCITLVTAAIAILGVGGIVGRWRFLPAPEAAPNAHTGADSLLMLAPVPAAKIGSRDLIVLAPKGSDHTRVYQVRAVLSGIDHTVEITDEHGVEQAIHLPATTWRVTREVPMVGRAVRAVPGSAVAWLLILAGIGFLAFARFRPARQRPDSA